ncbi:MAG: hypothetical protein HY671_00490 [Chloroflexi bacterium]|nr:hypothetical protein [Chloroflexota bacterium]
MADLKTRLGNLALDNPIIVSSGYATETPHALRKADAFGPGAIIIKSSLVDEEYSKVVKPYAPHLYPSCRGAFTSCEDGLLVTGAMSPWSLELWAEWLAKNVDGFHSPLIASVAAVSLEGYVKGARMMEQAGAKGVELLLACPAPYFRPFKYSMNAEPKVTQEICQAVKSAVKVPVGAKIAPMSVMAKAAKAAGVDWITLGGGPLAYPEIDLETVQPRLPTGLFICGTHVNKMSTFYCLVSVSKMSADTHFSAHGGAQDWKDAAEFILYGASSVQAHATFMVKGFSVIESMRRGLAEYMDKHGFSRIEDMRGSILPKLLTFNDLVEAYPRTKGKIVALVDEANCSGCGICEDVCAYDAIHVVNGIARAMSDRCEGCNLCIVDCPTKAIVLKNTELMRRSAAGV